MRKSLRPALLVPWFLLASACGIATNLPIQKTSANGSTTNTLSIIQNTAVRNTSTSNQNSHNIESPLPSNVLRKEEPSAAEVVKQFYNDINAKQYKQAFALFGPDSKVDANVYNRKYFYNMERVTVSMLKDITSKPGLLYNTNYSRFYDIKFYYGVLNFKQYNPSLNPRLEGSQTMRFTLVQMHKNSPWLIDEASNVPARSN